MAKGADIVAGGCPAHTIYIWPSRELIARSWDWPEAWHEAFEQAAGQLASLVATCVLGGLPVTQEPATRPLRAGWVSFRVRCCGTRIYITVLDFEGPHAPGPNGGTRKQPCPVDALVLGLRGSGKSFTIVTFYGPLPPVPAEDIIRGPRESVMRFNIQENSAFGRHSRRHPSTKIMWLPGGARSMLPNGMRQRRITRSSPASVLKFASGEGRNGRSINLALKEPRYIGPERRGRDLRRKEASLGSDDLEWTGFLSLRLRRSHVGCWIDRGKPSDGHAGMHLH